jgi:hypothetical protein
MLTPVDTDQSSAAEWAQRAQAQRVLFRGDEPMGDAGVGWIAAIIIGGIQKRAVADYLAGLEAEAQVQQDGDGRGSGSDRSARSQAAEGDLAFRSVLGVDGQLQTLLTRSRDVIGLTQMAICRALVALARIWREILKLIRLTFPFFGIYRRVTFDRYIGPGFCVISVELKPLLGSILGVGLDRFDRTFRLTYPTIDAFVGMDDEHVFALVETIDGAYFHAIHQLALDAGFIDDISQMSSSLRQRQPYQICLC